VKVPQGKYAKVRIGKRSILLAAGTHVMNDAQFALAEGCAEMKQALVDVTQVRTHTPGCRGRVTHAAPREQNFIEHGTIRILRVPIGRYCKVWVNNLPFLLQPRPDEPCACAAPRPGVHNGSLVCRRVQHAVLPFRRAGLRALHVRYQRKLCVAAAPTSRVWQTSSRVARSRVARRRASRSHPRYSRAARLPGQSLVSPLRDPRAPGAGGGR
jgi:hypothetical protein